MLFRFRTLVHLHAWMTSAEREAHLLQLQPLLHAPDVYTAASSRALPDTFTDLLVPNNGTAPLRPPPKVCDCTTAKRGAEMGDAPCSRSQCKCVYA